jgi:transcriptional regulator with XRE-family HTH domain
MPKYTNTALVDFGKRLAKLRKEAGFTQKELADEIGATRRVIAYYETESAHPPANLLVDLAQALNVSTDELLGVKPLKKKAREPDSRLLRRIQQLEKLDPATKRQVMQVIDTYLEAAQLKKQA